MSSLLTTTASSTQINILSLTRLAMGTAGFFAPAFLSQRFFGFSNRTLSGSSATASTTSVKNGSPEELTLAIRLFAVRDVAMGLLLRDTNPMIVERVVQMTAINGLLDIAAVVFGFIEGNLSRETASAVGGFAAVSSLFSYYILQR